MCEDVQEEASQVEVPWKIIREEGQASSARRLVQKEGNVCEDVVPRAELEENLTHADLLRPSSTLKEKSIQTVYSEDTYDLFEEGGVNTNKVVDNGKTLSLEPED